MNIGKLSGKKIDELISENNWHVWLYYVVLERKKFNICICRFVYYSNLVKVTLINTYDVISNRPCNFVCYKWNFLT